MTLCVILAPSCVNDDGIVEQKEVVPLTISEAKKTFELYVGSTLRVKSESDKDIEIAPDWLSAVEYENDYVYIVESNLEFRNNRERIIMTENVFNYVMEQGQNTSLAYQSSRLVMMRNKKSGKTYAFNMYIIPEIDYLKDRSSIEKNTYLSRDEKLDGLVLFYKAKGEFINGWKYKNGKIVSALKPEGYIKGNYTKADEGGGDCYPYIERDEEGNITGGGRICFKKNNNEEDEQIDYGDHGGDGGDGGVDNHEPLSGGGSGSGIYTSNYKKVQEAKKPEKIKSDPNVIKKIESIWKEAKNATSKANGRVEKGFFIYYDPKTDKYYFGKTRTSTYVKGENTHGSVKLGNPNSSDNLHSGIPKGAVAVGSFHTHTSLTYENSSLFREVGPSQADYNYVKGGDTSAFIYDYVGEIQPDGTIGIWGGHPIDAPAKIWVVNP